MTGNVSRSHGMPTPSIDRGGPPRDGPSPELAGYRHRGPPVSLIFFDGPPGRGPTPHRHPYAEIFVVQKGAPP